MALDIVLDEQLGSDDLFDVVGDSPGRSMHICDAALGEPSEFLPTLLDLVNLFT